MEKSSWISSCNLAVFKCTLALLYLLGGRASRNGGQAFYFALNDRWSVAGQCAAPQTCRYEIYESEHEIRGEYWGGFTRHNVIRRQVFDGDEHRIGDEFVAENHAVMMYNPMLEQAPLAEKVY